jgi:ribosomal protein L11
MGFTRADEQAEKFAKIMAENQAKKDGKAGVGYGNYLTGTAPTVTTPTVTTPTVTTPTHQPPGYDANGNKTVVTGQFQSGSATFDGSGIPKVNDIPSTGGGQAETPTPTEQEKKPSGALGYGAWLEQSGNDTQAAYERAVAAARRQYAMNRASFGLRGEQLGRAGLTGSGYGDYLEGKAYASMVGAEATAEAQKAEGDRQNAIGYASYLTAKDNEAYQKRVGLYDALVKTGSTDRATLEKIAKIYAPDMDAAELEEVLGAAMSVGTANRQNTVNSLVGTLLGKTDGTVSKEAYTTLIKDVLPDATDDEIASIIGQVETTLGEKIKTEDEVKAETEAALKDEQDTAIRVAVGNAIAEGNYTTVADWEFAAKQLGYTEDQIEVGRQTIYDYNARDKEMMIENAASLSDMAAMTPAEFEKDVGKTLDQARADELMKKVQEKTGEILRQALKDYQAGDDSSVAALLGVESDAFDKMSDGEKADAIFQATMEQYRIGTINVETTKEIASRMMTKTLQSKGTDMETIAGMSILLDNEFGASDDPVLVAANDRWQNILANSFDVSTIGTADIFITTNGKKQRVVVFDSDDEAINLPKENGTLQVNNGKLYMYSTIKDRYLKVEEIAGGVMNKDKEAALLKLLILKFTK